MIEKFKRENIIERENQRVVTDYVKPNVALVSYPALNGRPKFVFDANWTSRTNFGSTIKGGVLESL